jgi:hypothetical protein
VRRFSAALLGAYMSDWRCVSHRGGDKKIPTMSNYPDLVRLIFETD